MTSNRTAVRATADKSLCVGAGLCVIARPDIFEQSDEDGLVRVIKDVLPADDMTELEAIAGRCPARAISLTLLDAKTT